MSSKIKITRLENTQTKIQKSENRTEELKTKNVQITNFCLIFPLTPNLMLVTFFEEYTTKSHLHKK